MRKTNCYEAFHEGRALRLQYPLRLGQYKLEECQSRLQSCRDEVGRIRAVVRNEACRWSLMHCTADDKHIWLKDLPRHVAYRLGYEVLPGLAALGEDGADQRDVDITFPHIEQAAHALVGRLESVRVTISKRIGVEYWHMKQGGSLLEPLVDKAIFITQRSLSVL